MKAILFPTDFTRSSEEFFHLVCSIARDNSAEIIVLHVLAIESCVDQPKDGDELDRDSAYFQSCWNRFLQLQEMAGDIPVSLQVKIGRAVQTIVSVAQRECCDLIALVAPTRTDVCSHFQRSIPESLMRVATCRVLCLSQSLIPKESSDIPESLRQLQEQQQ
jgi:nucleotide-binding universal stress UspA family protein